MIGSYIARTADELLKEYPDRSPSYLADELERSVDAFDEGPEVAALIVAELRARAQQGVRFKGWVYEARSPSPSNDTG